MLGKSLILYIWRRFDFNSALTKSKNDEIGKKQALQVCKHRLAQQVASVSYGLSVEKFELAQHFEIEMKC